MDALQLLATRLNAEVDGLMAARNAAFRNGDETLGEKLHAEVLALGREAGEAQAAANAAQIARLGGFEIALRAAVARQRAAGLGTAADAVLQVLTDVFGPQPDLAPTAPAPAAPAPAAPAPAAPAPAAPAGAGPQVTELAPRADPARPDVEKIVGKLIAASRGAGIDALLTLTIVEIESDFVPDARPPRDETGKRASSAGGLFQVLNKTWTGEGGAPHGAGEADVSHAARAPLEEQIAIGLKIIGANLRAVSAHLGAPATAADVYIAHQQGLAGYKKLMAASPMAPVEAVIGVDEAEGNRLSGLSVGQALARLRNLVDGERDRVLATRVSAVFADRPVPGAVTAAAPLASQRFAAGGARPIAEQAAIEAGRERATFARTPAGATILETSEPLQARVLAYFRQVGRPDIRRGDQEPWSAAFISHVMRAAGAAERAFPFAAAHSRYILHALRNAKDGVVEGQLVFRDAGEARLRVGDLIGFSRTSHVTTRADIEKRLTMAEPHFAAHTDIVTALLGDRATALGGNVGQTIGGSTVMLDAQGALSKGQKHWFVLEVNF